MLNLVCLCTFLGSLGKCEHWNEGIALLLVYVETLFGGIDGRESI